MNARPISVTLLDRDYQVACPPDEETSLRAAAAYLNKKMREVRDRGVIGSDRIAVMAALNIAHELLQLQPIEDDYAALGQRIQSLRKVLDEALQEETNSQKTLLP